MKAVRRKGLGILRVWLIGGAFAAGSLIGIGVRTAGAAEPSPGGGPEFGRHVAAMAHEHAGPDFGQCVSAMATGAGCPHIHQP